MCYTQARFGYMFRRLSHNVDGLSPFYGVRCRQPVQRFSIHLHVSMLCSAQLLHTPQYVLGRCSTDRRSMLWCCNRQCHASDWLQRVHFPICSCWALRSRWIGFFLHKLLSGGPITIPRVSHQVPAPSWAARPRHVLIESLQFNVKLLPWPPTTAAWQHGSTSFGA